MSLSFLGSGKLLLLVRLFSFFDNLFFADISFLIFIPIMNSGLPESAVFLFSLLNTIAGYNLLSDSTMTSLGPSLTDLTVSPRRRYIHSI